MNNIKKFIWGVCLSILSMAVNSLALKLGVDIVTKGQLQISMGVYIGIVAVFVILTHHESPESILYAKAKFSTTEVITLYIYTIVNPAIWLLVLWVTYNIFLLF